MNSRVSWSVDGIDPSVRERAEAAARRAGMSLSDWLNSTIGEPLPPSFSAPSSQRPAMPSRESRDVADIHQRLDSITRQIEQISRPAPRSGDVSRGEAARGEPTVARQLNDAISRLDARLSQISNPAPTRQAQMQEKQRQTDLVERAAAQVYRPAPPLSPASMDFAIAEITARQNELDGPPRQMPPRNGAPTASNAQPAQPMMQAAPAGPDFSSLERHLLKITSQIEALQRPDHVEEFDCRLPQRTRRNPPRHHRGGAAPGDRFARERDSARCPVPPAGSARGRPGRLRQGPGAVRARAGRAGGRPGEGPDPDGRAHRQGGAGVRHRPLRPDRGALRRARRLRRGIRGRPDLLQPRPSGPGAGAADADAVRRAAPAGRARQDPVRRLDRRWCGVGRLGRTDHAAAGRADQPPGRRFRSCGCGTTCGISRAVW